MERFSGKELKKKMDLEISFWSFLKNSATFYSACPPVLGKILGNYSSLLVSLDNTVALLHS